MPAAADAKEDGAIEWSVGDSRSKCFARESSTICGDGRFKMDADRRRTGMADRSCRCCGGGDGSGCVSLAVDWTW